MKKTKVIIPALGLLLLSTAASVTGTVAWFAAQNAVTAGGMAIMAKSDNTFLLIGSGDNNSASAIQAAATNDAVDFAMTVSESKVYPSAPCMTAAEAAYLPASTGKKVGGDAITVAGAQITNETTANAVTNWYTATAANVNAPDMLSGSARQLTAFTGYVIKKTVYLTVAAGANPAHNLSVAGTFTQNGAGNDLAAARVLITTDDGNVATILDSTHLTADISGSNTNITSTTVRTVNFYIFYDGNAAPVYTNNAANLTGATFSFSFSVDAVPAA